VFIEKRGVVEELEGAVEYGVLSDEFNGVG